MKYSLRILKIKNLFKRQKYLCIDYQIFWTHNYNHWGWGWGGGGEVGITKLSNR